ncbi:alpha/beta fold hydrolase [Natranaerofaba carboxydovora]|uniref:alpha/beta fold hydrolase n=1 Tax=Natranaerofaba carboxydovora TaxID=2742683 RepID=UPI001F135A1C|nr:alpha/beta hydrolase [Natranaerofaba carboxydovora]UMZ74067.1 alpha/beta hydrolase fold protein [Natranaerofaba carboxydovora]
MKKKKIFKWIMIGIPLLLIVGVIFIVGSSYFEHRELVTQEKKEYPAPGTLVDVNDDGDQLHVYSEGDGEVTLVFMSGLGTSSPVYDFKVLYDKLSDDYRIAVVERAGYGWSDITSSSRDIDTVLEQTRTALQLSGESPPYVLFPHSMAGMEAIHWANLHPEEIKAIVGLDPLIPDYYEQTEDEPSPSRVITLLARTGLMRQQPDVFNDNFPAMKKGHLTEEEAEIARTIFFRRTQTKNMWDEADSIPTNSQTVSLHGEPDVPFHVFISVENEDEYWKESLISFSESTAGEYFVLDAEHYIHLDKPELIAEKSKKLIEMAAGN